MKYPTLCCKQPLAHTMYILSLDFLTQLVRQASVFLQMRKGWGSAVKDAVAITRKTSPKELDNTTRHFKGINRRQLKICHCHPVVRISLSKAPGNHRSEKTLSLLPPPCIRQDVVFAVRNSRERRATLRPKIRAGSEKNLHEPILLKPPLSSVISSKKF